MKQWVGYILLALCLVASYQGWKNSQQNPELAASAEAMACQVDQDCLLKGEKGPNKIKTDFFSQSFQFDTSIGPVTVKCTRAMFLFGAWKCASSKGSINS